MSGHKICVWAQTYTLLPRHDCDHTIITCQSTNVSGHKRVWAQTCLGTIVWAQVCMGTNVWSPFNRGNEWSTYHHVSECSRVIPPLMCTSVQCMVLQTQSHLLMFWQENDRKMILCLFTEINIVLFYYTQKIEVN